MDGKAREDVQGAEKEIHKRTSISSTGLGQKYKNRSWYIKLYNRSVVTTTRHKVSVKQSSGEKHKRIWQGTTTVFYWLFI